MTSLDAHYRQRCVSVADRLEHAREPRIVRMLNAQQRRIDADHRRRVAALEERSQVDIIAQRIAIGRLEVVDAQ
jgi:hypothetical protein